MILSAHPDAARKLGFVATVPDPRVGRARSDAGVWWIDPCGVLPGGVLVGGILSPRGESVYGEASRQGSYTWTSRLHAFVPIMYYHRMVGRTKSRWLDARGRWPAARDSLVALHRALGGTDLDEFEIVLADDRLMEAVTEGGGARAAAEREVLRRLHPGVDVGRFVQFLESLEADPNVPVPPGLGAWQHAASVRAFQARLRTGVEDDETAGLAWDCHRAPGWLDGGFEEPTRVFSWPSLATVFHVGESAARFVDQHFVPRLGVTGDPWARLATNMAGLVLTGSYDGMGHLETAALLDVEGRPEEAWDALVSAALWTWNFSNVVNPAIGEAALHLARSRGWDEIVESMSKLAGA